MIDFDSSFNIIFDIYWYVLYVNVYDLLLILHSRCKLKTKFEIINVCIRLYLRVSNQNTLQNLVSSSNETTTGSWLQPIRLCSTPGALPGAVDGAENASS